LLIIVGLRRWKMHCKKGVTLEHLEIYVKVDRCQVICDQSYGRFVDSLETSHRSTHKQYCYLRWGEECAMGFPYARASTSRSATLWKSVLLALLHTTLRPTVSQYLLYVVFLSFGLRLGANWLSLRCRLLKFNLNLRVLLLLVHPTWNKLSQSLRDLSPISFDQFHRHLKTSLFVSEDIDLDREHLWYKWRYINTWLGFRIWTNQSRMKWYIMYTSCAEAIHNNDLFFISAVDLPKCCW